MMVSPSFTKSPSLTLSAFTVPATGDCTGICIFIDSSITTSWSTTTASPGFTRNSKITPAMLLTTRFISVQFPLFRFIKTLNGEVAALNGIDRIATFREARLFGLVHAVASDQLSAQGLERGNGINDHFRGKMENINILGIFCLHHFAERLALLFGQLGDLV